MHAQRADRDWTAIAVVSGMIDLLKVRGDIDALVQLAIIKQFEDLFRSIPELPVAKDEAETARRQIVAVFRRQPVEDTGQTHLVSRPTPARSLQQHPQTRRLVNL